MEAIPASLPFFKVTEYADSAGARRSADELASLAEQQPKAEQELESGVFQPQRLPLELQFMLLEHMPRLERTNLGKTSTHWRTLVMRRRFQTASAKMNEYEKAGRLDPNHETFHKVFAELPIAEINSDGERQIGEKRIGEKQKGERRIDGLIGTIPDIRNELHRSWAVREAMKCWPQYTEAQQNTLLRYAIDGGYNFVLQSMGGSGFRWRTSTQQHDWAKAVLTFPVFERLLTIGRCDAGALTAETLDLLRRNVLELSPSEERKTALDNLSQGAAAAVHPPEGGPSISS
jgi:F-box associated protein